MKRLAIYPGSFDPFTKAHLDIVDQARRIFDKVIILVADNPNKHCMFTADQRVEMIESLLSKNGNIRVEKSSDLVAHYAYYFVNLYDGVFIVRGLRPGNASEELELAQIYAQDFGRGMDELQTVFLPVYEPDHLSISSTRVREYIRRAWEFGIERCCPQPISQYIKHLIRESYIQK